MITLLALSLTIMLTGQEDYRLVREWGELINDARLEFDLEESLPVAYQYSFLHTACQCSVSRAVESPVAKQRQLTTWAFDLSTFDQVTLLIGKPKDYNFDEVEEDIWYVEIGTVDVLIQDSGFKSQQTSTTHFGFHVEGEGARDRLIEATKRAIYTCGGKVAEVSIREE